MEQKLTILGVGNILLKDEGAGVHAVQKIEKIISHPDIRIIDGGTLGLDLLPIIEESKKLIIIDCVKGGGKPGTIYRFTPDEIKKSNNELKLSLHDFNLVDVLNLAKALNKEIPEIIIYGIEPESLDWGLEPTEAVSSAIEKVVSEIVNNLRKEYGDEVLLKKESD